MGCACGAQGLVQHEGAGQFLLSVSGFGIRFQDDLNFEHTSTTYFVNSNAVMLLSPKIF